MRRRGPRAVLVGDEQPAQGLDRRRLDLADAGVADAEHRADLLLGEAAEEVQRDDRALTLGELRDRLADLLRVVGGLCLKVRSEQSNRRFLLGVKSWRVPGCCRRGCGGMPGSQSQA